MYTLQVFNSIDGRLITTILGFDSYEQAIDFYSMYYDISFLCVITQQDEICYV